MLEAFQIPINDILIRIRQNEIVLRSKKYNKRIIPRLTAAHNFTHTNLPIYKFLCDLQLQGLAIPGAWNWGPLAAQRHLPRVSYKNLIIQKAKWKVYEKDITDIPKEFPERITYFKGFCKKFNMPSRFSYVENRDYLLIDLEDPRGIDLFIFYLQKNKVIELEEFLFTEENCIVRDSSDRKYSNQIIIPIIVNKQPTILKPDLSINSDFVNIKRKFPPNSEWISFKIYCGSKTAEKILKYTLWPFVASEIEKQAFERFFFVRYRDESGHLRIRFYNRDVNKQVSLQRNFLNLMQPYLDNDYVHSVYIDTYVRELERYGGETMTYIEEIFYNDSLAVLRLIDLLDNMDDDKYRLLVALRGVGALLNDFGYCLDDKVALLEPLKNSFFQEYGSSGILQKQLNAKYRERQRDIFSFMKEGDDLPNEIMNTEVILKARSSSNEHIIYLIKKLNSKINTNALDSIVTSIIHMYLNRLFMAQQRKYELIIYYFLHKYFASQLRINKK